MLSQSLSLIVFGPLLVSSRAVLLTYTKDASNSLTSTCLSESYHGTYGSGTQVFFPTLECMDNAPKFLNGGSIVSFDWVGIEEGWHEFVFVQESGVEGVEAELDVEEMHRRARVLLAKDQEHVSDAQIPMQDSPYEVKDLILVHQTTTEALLAVSPTLLRYMDMLLPSHFTPVLVPLSPLPMPNRISSKPTRLEEVLANLTFSPKIAQIVHSIEIPQLISDIRYLTGEAPSSNILTRQSFTQGALQAAAWISDVIEQTGTTCEQKVFLEGWAPNVICRYSGFEKTTETIILGAHYDSRGSFGQTRAPGANDDGSGTIAMLSIARTIGRLGLDFGANVEICFFAGEEQGLVGSRAYAQEMRREGRNLTLMIQSDMLAFHAPGERSQLGIPNAIGSPTLIKILIALSELYSPQLTAGFTFACCSDHQSFVEQGFEAAMVFERAGGIVDPMYHNSGDLSNRTGWDVEQVWGIGGVVFATLLHATDWQVAEPLKLDG